MLANTGYSRKGLECLKETCVGRTPCPSRGGASEREKIFVHIFEKNMFTFN